MRGNLSGYFGYTTSSRGRLGSISGRRAVLGALGIDCPAGCIPAPQQAQPAQTMYYAPAVVQAPAPVPQKLRLREADWSRSSGVVASRINKVPENFDEDAYLNKHPDVAKAIDQGVMPSGLWHYMKYGRNEGRALAGWRQRPGNLSGISAMWNR